ncbi:MAG TPA: L,D-transpeptidase family protein [Patescibacteria group bacterium]|nr:L,D-transpeptidase family protein [Patescibacteria group bacterium]
MSYRVLIAAVFLLCSTSATQLGAAQPADESDPTQQFYRERQGDLAWSGGVKAIAQAREALVVLSRSASEGLDPERYRVFRMGDDTRAYDLSLTKAVLTYMRDVSEGRQDLRSVDADVGLPAQSKNFAAMLDKALRQGRLTEMLDGLPPRHPAYIALRAALPRSGDKSEIVAANMERWRWLPAVLEPDRIVVNAAESQLELWLGDNRVLTSRVIVGRPTQPTPILRAEGAAVTFNPSWTVPHSIAAKEILPKLKRNHAWLVGHDMVLLNGPPGDPHGLQINWKAVRMGTFPYQIRQYPGPRNPLGRIKLELPNKFQVYLHDTPDKALFNKSKRQLSHGCVRVEQIVPLASYMLTGDFSTTDKITKAIESGETITMPAQKKLPVYFLYWTAVPGSDGALKYVSDVYGRDRRLIAAMHSKQLRIASIDAPCLKG